MTNKEVMQMALDAITDWGVSRRKVAETVEALRTALAQPEHLSDCAVHNEPAYPAGECDCKLPVAWWNKIKNAVSTDPYYRKDKECIPLYTAPPQREWVGLTDDEVLKEFWNIYPEEDVLFTDVERAFYRAIEAKLKERNT